jgi:dehydrogenase/reductase SDR family member 12
MARYVTSMLVRRSAGDTFAFISDLRNAPLWDSQTIEAYKISEGPIGAGTCFRLVGAVLGRKLDLPYQIQLYNAPNELVIAGETAIMRYRDRITLTPRGPETHLTYEAWLHLKGAFRLANPLLSLVFWRIGDTATRRMPEAVERLA